MYLLKKVKRVLVEKMGNSQNVKSKKKIPEVNPPPQFMSQDEFFETWDSWKKNFQIFQRTVNEDINNKNRWGNCMLNLMGPIGQDIYSTFTFNTPDATDNLDILLAKFDEYYIFGTRKRKFRENIYEYIDDLRSMIKSKGVQNGDEVIRKKILTEINKDHFITAAKTVLPTFIFNYHFEQLTLKEIAFIWMLYSNDLMKNCKKCGRDHDTNDKCPALGKQCAQCNDWDHYCNRCPLKFIDNCHFCGGCHFKKKCPAYNETCTKCQGQHHFSWKCQRHEILCCRFCGLTHAASRSRCLARNTICSICHGVGHVPARCNRTSRSHRN